MKKLANILFLCVLSIILNAQNDSLKLIQDKVDDLNSIAEQELYNGNTQKSIDISEESLNISKRISYSDGHLQSLLILARSFFSNGDLSGALKYYFQRIKELEKNNNEYLLALTNIEVGIIFSEGNLDEKALEYFLKALPYYNKEKKLTSLVELNGLIADSYLKQNLIKEALEYYNLQKDFLQINNMGAELIKVLRKIVGCYYNLEEYDKAFRYNIQIKEISKKIKDQKSYLSSLNNIGYNFKYLNKPDSALYYFQLALFMCQQNDSLIYEKADAFTNISVIYFVKGEINKSINNIIEAVKIFELYGTIEDKVRINNLASSIYLKKKDYYNAQVYSFNALDYALKSSNKELQKNSLKNIYKVYQKKEDYENAIIYYDKYRALTDSLALISKLKQQELIQQQIISERIEKELKLRLIDEELSEMTINKIRLESEKNQKELELLKKNKDYLDIQIKNKELEKKKTQQELELIQERLLAQQKDKEIGEFQHREEVQQLLMKQVQDEKENEIELLKKNEQIKNLELKDQETRSKYLFIGFILILVILVLSIIGFINARRAKNQLAVKNIEIEEERRKSEELLLNILPEKTARELKDNGFAETKRYENVSIMFTDFVSFTKIAEQYKPSDLVNKLDMHFRAFDEIISRRNLEKIKTIGDAYMCAGGVPEASENNAINCVLAAFDILEYLNIYNNSNEINWNIRLGIHTGVVVAGVVGKNKFAYDIWGDAVNIASRMETSSEPLKINISGETYQKVKDFFNCTYRGKIEAKNKGVIDMYFVDSIK